jgi:hypothetical protein
VVKKCNWENTILTRLKIEGDCGDESEVGNEGGSGDEK